MTLIPTPLVDVFIYTPKLWQDERGWFMESYQQENFNQALAEHGKPHVNFVQDNHSCSNKGVLRGLHFQYPPDTQGKLVRVLAGRAWDVALDIRPHSATYRQWYALELSATNRRQLWLPEGFAHGILALENHTEILYKTTAPYRPEREGSILWNDPELAIDWQQEGIEHIILSSKDKSAPTFAEISGSLHTFKSKAT